MNSKECFNLGEIIGAAGWRQGSIFEASFVDRIKCHLSENITHRLVNENCCAILISQDCDIVRHQDTEWNVEVIFGEWTSEPSNQYTHGRHERILSLCCTDRQSNIKLDIRNRAMLSKQDFLFDSCDSSYVSINLHRNQDVHRPNSEKQLNPEATLLLGSWLGRRYTRPAFPDAFNKRITPSVDRKIEKLTKSTLSKNITAVYLMLNEPEKDCHFSGSCTQGFQKHAPGVEA